MRRSHPTASLIAATILLLALAGCGEKDEPTLEGLEPPGTLSVVVEPGIAKPGDTVRASVVNETASQFTYGADYGLEREGPNGFRPVELPDRPVIQIAHIAEPGETGPPVRVQVPRDAEPGLWRVVIQRDVAGVGDLTGEFQVRNG